ncbi:protein of unknown function [Hymenobacter daecheongensis DSM 21074]|uniref:Uncharacterized protein n=1 Tax=Hymenobacter daecheongensis DSM 21074 TaxID=1121955 RepID=A0A1M6CKM5_9BACT|nr:DUF4173 domain-containing protein [Hymenobacter daecheongensis]SHI61562.1 protein of unknown function [Hymenobacter daecheongensis DSM 21074]
MTTISASAAQWPVSGPAPAPPFPLTALQKLLLPAGAILFDVLFWQERAALNLLLYTLFVVGGGLAGLPRAAPVWRSGYFWLTLAGTLLSAEAVAVHGSGAARLSCVVSLAAWLGYVNQAHLKLVGFALLTGLANLLPAARRLLQMVRLPANVGGQLSRAWYYGRLLGLPLLALGVFHVLFAVANPRYSALTNRALTLLGEALELLFERLSIPHLLFFGLGLLLTAGGVLILPVHFFADQESRYAEFVRRQRDRVASFAVRRPDFRPRTFRALDLRKEYLMALGLIGLVNALLLAVNVIDIRWIWFGFVPAPGFDLTQFVHEGTYALILSILVAMAIVLWFFRRNLNFYQPGLRVLRWGATVWVLQNAVLAVSVGLRNYYYIQHTGLAYKRIGVYGFLLLTFFGLGTVLLKIWQRRSAYALVRLNAVAAYALLLVLAAGNWEIWMVRYNLQARFRQVDYGFLLDMPDRVLPALAAREARLAGRELNREAYNNTWVPLPLPMAHRLLHARIRSFQARQVRRRWPSHTWADYQAARYFEAHPLTTASHAPTLR